MNRPLLQGDCEVALVISDLGSGGAQRVLVQLAGAGVVPGVASR